MRGDGRMWEYNNYDRITRKHSVLSQAPRLDSPRPARHPADPPRGLSGISTKRAGEPMTLMSDTLVTPETRPAGRQDLGRLSRAQLGQIVATTAARPSQWRDLVRYDPAHRWYFRM